MRFSAAVRFLAVAVTLLPAATPSFAQAVANAQIHGAVADSTGAVVPGAQVRATQTDIGQVRAVPRSLRR